MDSRRFDGLSRVMAMRLDRRRAAIAGIVAGGAWLSQAEAQEASPTPLSMAPPAGSPEPNDVREFLFVQTFQSGTWMPIADRGDLFLLTLNGGAAQTIYFSDRPERITGVVSMQLFLDGLGFTPQNPPNAALVIPQEDGLQEVVIIELMNPVYEADAAGGPTLTYEARVLSAYYGEGLEHLASLQSGASIPETMENVSLFIDDCPDVSYCHDDGGRIVGDIPGGPFGSCWSWSKFSCNYCKGDPSRDELVARCNQAYEGCVEGSKVFGCTSDCCWVPFG